MYSQFLCYSERLDHKLKREINVRKGRVITLQHNEASNRSWNGLYLFLDRVPHHFLEKWPIFFFGIELKVEGPAPSLFICP